MGIFGARPNGGLLQRLAWLNANPMYGILASKSGEFAVDDFGSLIRFESYGDCDCLYGWEIDHKVPKAVGGSDTPNNLRALHYRNNRALGGKLGSFLHKMAELKT